jgi:hypothetical protein
MAEDAQQVAHELLVERVVVHDEDVRLGLR